MVNRSAVKYFTLITSVLAFIIGWILAFMPLEASVIVNYIIVITLGIMGIAKICQFISDTERNGWDLVMGILYLIVAIILLSNGALVLEVTAGYILAFLAIIGGIKQFVISGRAKTIWGQSRAWFILTGILEILVGICLIVLPIFVQGLAFWLFGIFLIVYAIISFIQGLMIKTKPAKKKNNHC